MTSFATSNDTTIQRTHRRNDEGSLPLRERQAEESSVVEPFAYWLGGHASEEGATETPSINASSTSPTATGATATGATSTGAAKGVTSAGMGVRAREHPDSAFGILEATPHEGREVRQEALRENLNGNEDSPAQRASGREASARSRSFGNKGTGDRNETLTANRQPSQAARGTESDVASRTKPGPPPAAGRVVHDTGRDDGRVNRGSSQGTDQQAVARLTPQQTAASASTGGRLGTPAAEVARALAEGPARVSGARSTGDSARVAVASPADQKARNQARKPAQQEAARHTPQHNDRSPRAERKSVEAPQFDRIVKAMRLKAGAQRTTARMLLDPPDLGRVTVQVRMEKNALTVDVATQSNEARELLMERIAHLKAALESHGIHVERFEVYEESQRPESLQESEDNRPGEGERNSDDETSGHQNRDESGKSRQGDSQVGRLSGRGESFGPTSMEDADGLGSELRNEGDGGDGETSNASAENRPKSGSVAGGDADTRSMSSDGDSANGLAQEGQVSVRAERGLDLVV